MSLIDTAVDPGKLDQAFKAFTQVSGLLESSYRDLERQVACLRRELADLREQQRRERGEAGRVAARLQRLLAVLPAGVIALDGDGRVCQSNPAARALLGDDLDGRGWREVVAERFRPRPDDGPDLTLACGRRVHIDTCSLGSEPGQLLLVSDVTRTRDLQGRLEHLRRLSALGNMAGTLAHQIRTPLASAVLLVGNLRARLVRGAGGRRSPEEICAQIAARLGSLERLVADLLAFARRGDFEVERVGVPALLDDVAAGARALARGARIEVTASPGAVVTANRAALASALGNLVGNALESGAPEARITLTARAGRGGTVEIAVSDDGPGVPPDLAARVFEPFFTTRASGTGLGLAVARAVAEAHGGSLGLADDGPARGACFVLRLPAPAGHATGERE